MANKGLQFEWCIYHLIAKAYPAKYKNDVNAKKAAVIFKDSDEEVIQSAHNALSVVTKTYGKITGVEKKSGGGVEPKTDLIISTRRKKLKCSLKYGGSVQLSSGGIKNTSKFLSGVIKAMVADKRISSKKAKNLLEFFTEMEEELGDLGSVPKQKAEKFMKNAEGYNLQLQNILGTRKNPNVADEFKDIKLAIVEEALTGKFTFASQPLLSADHILSEDSIKEIDDAFIKEIADKTSVRIALKGRGTKVVAGKETRLNEIVVRFDTV